MGSSTSILSKRRSKKKVSTMIQSKRTEFFATYQPQEFSLPESIMFYIAKNPTSPELYQKMVQTCKYFFVKNPILFISHFDYRGVSKWQYSLRPFDLSKISSQLWITTHLEVKPENSINKEADIQNILSSVMPKLYKCDAKYVTINYQIISCHDLSRILSSAEWIELNDIIVKNENDENVGIEKIVEVAVKAKQILIWSKPYITSNTMKELLKIPHFSKLGQFYLNHISEAFDLETFYSYMKKNKTTILCLAFDGSISEAYKNRLKEIVDEILATENRDYKAPSIYFVGQDWEKYYKLQQISFGHC